MERERSFGEREEKDKKEREGMEREMSFEEREKERREKKKIKKREKVLECHSRVLKSEYILFSIFRNQIPFLHILSRIVNI